MSRECVYGFNVVETLLDHVPGRIVRVYVDRKRRDARIADIISRCEGQGLSVAPVEAGKLSELTAGGHHQGVVVETAKVPVLDDRGVLVLLEDASQPLVCVLDNVQDPRNLGACLRTAEAAGVDAVILSRHDSCGITPVARQVSAGAAELLPVCRASNLARVLDRLQKELGVWVFGTADDAERSLFEIDLTGPAALAFGSEGRGLKRLTRACCDDLARIPTVGRIDSLNVSVAVGIGLFEAVRQRQGKGVS